MVSLVDSLSGDVSLEIVSAVAYAFTIVDANTLSAPVVTRIDT